MEGGREGRETKTEKKREDVPGSSSGCTTASSCYAAVGTHAVNLTSTDCRDKGEERRGENER